MLLIWESWIVEMSRRLQKLYRGRTRFLACFHALSGFGCDLSAGNDTSRLPTIEFRAIAVVYKIRLAKAETSCL